MALVKGLLFSKGLGMFYSQGLISASHSYFSQLLLHYLLSVDRPNCAGKVLGLQTQRPNQYYVRKLSGMATPMLKSVRDVRKQGAISLSNRITHLVLFPYLGIPYL